MAGLNGLMGEGGSLTVPDLASGIGDSSNKGLMKSARQSLSGNWLLVLLGMFLYTILYFSICLFGAGVSYFLQEGAASMALDGSESYLSFLKENIWVQVVVSVIGLAVGCFFLFGWVNFFRVLVDEGEARLEAFFAGGRKLFSTMLALLLLLGLMLAYELAAQFMLWFFMQGNLVGLILGIFILQILPIYLVLRFSMVFFILTDGDEFGAFGALRRSSEIMEGYKWKLFRLYFRFAVLWMVFFLPLFFVAVVFPAFAVHYSGLQEYSAWIVLAGVLWYVFGILRLIPYLGATYATFYDDIK
jgi:uncharacterized membrane protein